MFSFVPLILNYVRRDDARGTFVHSHHDWMIRIYALLGVDDVTQFEMKEAH